MPADVETTRLPGFPKGIYSNAPEDLIPPENVADAENVLFGLLGEVSSRGGITKFSTSDPAGMNIGRAIFHANLGGDKLVVVDDDDEVWVVDSSTSTTLASAGFNVSAGICDAVVFNNNLYLTSRGSNAGHTGTHYSKCKFDGTTWTNISDGTLDGSGTEFPIASSVLVAHERIFAGNVNTLGTASPSRVHFSDALTAETWQSNNYFDVDPDDGQQITNLVLFGERIVIFKNSKMFVLVGKEENSFALYPVSTFYGCGSNRGAAVVEEKLYWIDENQGFMVFDGADITRISDPIQDWYDANYVSSNADHVYSDGQYVYFSVRDGSSSTGYPNVTWVYSIRTESWSLFNAGCADAVIPPGTGTIYGVTATTTTDEGIFKMWEGSTDAGTAFSCFMKTGWLSLNDDVHTWKRIRSMDLVFDAGASNNTAVALDVFMDYSTSSTFSDSFDTSTANQDLVYHHVAGVYDNDNDPFARTFAFKISSTSGVPWVLSQIQFDYSQRRQRRRGQV